MIEGGIDEQVENNNNNSNKSSNNSVGIASVAAQIQERALQLVAERNALEDFQKNLQGKNKELEKEKELFENTRRSFLSVEQSRHGVELEYWNFREKERETKRLIESLQNDIKDLEENKQKIQENWEHMVVSILANQRMKHELYKRIMEGHVQVVEEKTRTRMRKLQKLSKVEQSLANEIAYMKKEQHNIQNEIISLEKRETDEDEEISAIAMQVRETLAKRKNLRQSLRTEQKVYQAANEDMLKWEKKCVPASSCP